mmetsp:Transcript_21405/g.65120  ORF Transcript_21405/g.65120 Transcript_21405/m.65120 type:complete len:260 (+) Transcript_21405:1517-2296(+)|eukprot:scaffold304720_cov33-Tisochrysis_lutea.AAC.3
MQTTLSEQARRVGGDRTARTTRGGRDNESEKRGNNRLATSTSMPQNVVAGLKWIPFLSNAASSRYARKIFDASQLIETHDNEACVRETRDVESGDADEALWKKCGDSNPMLNTPVLCSRDGCVHLRGESVMYNLRLQDWAAPLGPVGQGAPQDRQPTRGCWRLIKVYVGVDEVCRMHRATILNSLAAPVTLKPTCATPPPLSTTPSARASHFECRQCRLHQDPKGDSLKFTGAVAEIGRCTSWPLGAWLWRTLGPALRA